MKIRHHIPRFLLLTSGISGMLFFAAFDFIRPGKGLHFGTNQLAGFVISTIIVLTAMHTARSPRAKTWFAALLLLYIAGILFMGLKPSSYHLEYPRKFLITSRPPVYDFIINILGFIPFAYLLMTYRFALKQVRGIVMSALLALAAGMGTSLFSKSWFNTKFPAEPRL